MVILSRGCSVRWVVRGRFGDVLIAIRDDEPRLRFRGVQPHPV